MQLRSSVLTALEQLAANRLRSLLTVLGIVIAVASTISVVSVVQGFTRHVSDFLQGLGSNAMWVWPERPAGQAGKSFGRVTLDLADYLAVDRSCTALLATSPLVRRPGVKLAHGRDEVEVPLEGVAPAYHAIRNLVVEHGRPFSVVDVEQAHHVCVIGKEALRKVRGDENLVGGSIFLAGQRFRVVGLLQEKGAFLGSSQDDVVLIPYTTALKLFPASRTRMAFTAQAVAEDDVPEAKAQIVTLLRRRHKLKPYQQNDFQIRTQDEVLRAFQGISLVATAVLAGIVGISLLVGGIGIMNVMLVSVTERTREIGLRKAVGATRRDILAQFLAEAVTLSLIGGGIGIAIGYGAGALVSLHPQMVSCVVPWWAVALGFGISAGTGVVFGLLPAAKAALLNPIDALRHE
jgi:putative ABC transport system permease protein